MQIKYPILETMMLTRGIKKKTLFTTLGISGRSLYNKMNGLVPFTWPEVCTIQKVFFPDLTKEELFKLSDNDPKGRKSA